MRLHLPLWILSLLLACGDKDTPPVDSGTPCTPQVWYADQDGDGVGTADATTEACVAPEGHVDTAGDCDDTDEDVNPDAAELCDGVDNDCDGDIDEDVTTTYYIDGDGDDWGDVSGTYDACSVPSGYTAEPGDCDDGDEDINPDATEVCDELGTDEDCDGLVNDEDDSLDTGTASTWYVDVDGDGWGDDDVSSVSCEAPSGSIATAGDCDDDDGDINPDATEVCDPDDVDEDCNGVADDDDSGVDSSTMSTWYADTDIDGFGDADSASSACDEPSGSVADDTDCDDGDKEINPDATEICDEIDNDCDGDIDDDDSDVDTSTGSTWYADTDTDGYGDPDVTLDACEEPSGYADNDDDCDDDETAINPAEDEVCDSAVDEDCDGDTDCDDSDCTGTTACPSTESDCSDGNDDDSDGLVDCEDGDCAGDAACEESVCDDSIDNDNDGLTDCADDECLGDPSCPAVVAKQTSVTGGQANVHFSSYSFRRWRGPPHDSVSGSFTWRSGDVLSGTITQLFGYVDVATSSAPSSVRAQCQWYASDIVFRRYDKERQNRNYDRIDYTTSQLTVGSSWLSSACPLPTSAQFLPTILFPARNGAIHLARSPDLLFSVSWASISNSPYDGLYSWALPSSSSATTASSVWSSWDTVTTYWSGSTYLATTMGWRNETSVTVGAFTGGTVYPFP